MYYTYILYSSKYLKTYVGITENVERRLEEHNSKKSNYTSKFVPWEVVHFETFDNREEARKREKYLKSSGGRRWMKDNINWPHSSTCLD